jgi:hypothetical protein
MVDLFETEDSGQRRCIKSVENTVICNNSQSKLSAILLYIMGITKDVF